MRVVSAGKVTKDVRPGSSKDGTVPRMDAMQQPLAQKWQVAGWSAELLSASGSTSLA
jgi:hypothetical protein